MVHNVWVGQYETGVAWAQLYKTHAWLHITFLPAPFDGCPLPVAPLPLASMEAAEGL